MLFFVWLVEKQFLLNHPDFLEKMCSCSFHDVIAFKDFIENIENCMHVPYLKGNAQFVQKVTFERLMDFKQNHY